MKPWPLLAALLFVPAAVSAGEGVTLRHGPAEPTCVEPLARDAVVAGRWGKELGGPKTRTALKRLIEAGPASCDLVANWLGAGARGGDSDDIKEVVLALLRTGSDEHVAVAAPYILSQVPATVARAAVGLETRLAVLPESWVASVVASATSTWPVERAAPDPRAALIGLLLGFHTEGEIQFDLEGPATVPVWVESETWGAESAPPVQHVAGIVSLLETELPEVERIVATYVDRMLREGLPGEETWAPLLLPLLDSLDFNTSRPAARALGLAQPDGLHAAVEAILATRPSWKPLRPLLKGVELRLVAGRVDARTVDLLRMISGAAAKPEARRAARLRKRFEAQVD